MDRHLEHFSKNLETRILAWMHCRCKYRFQFCQKNIVMTIWQWLSFCQDNFFDNDNGKKLFLPNSSRNLIKKFWVARKKHRIFMVFSEKFYVFTTFMPKMKNNFIEFLDKLSKNNFFVIVMTIVTWQRLSIVKCQLSRHCHDNGKSSRKKKFLKQKLFNMIS